MGYKMKGPTFFNKKSPMKITSAGNTSMVDAWKAAADSGAEKEVQMGKDTWEGIGGIAEGIKGVAGKMQGEGSTRKYNRAERKSARADKLEGKGKTEKAEKLRGKSTKIKKKIDAGEAVSSMDDPTWNKYQSDLLKGFE